ncbi:MAG TPA: hypothetical protein VHN18_17745 [Micromonosporaceae bacterium]|nr:hypothetical protein [Micromonosporaceae bacterium]
MRTLPLRRTHIVAAAVVAIVALLPAPPAAAGDGSWPQANHDAASTDANPEVTTISGPVAGVWASDHFGVVADLGTPDQAPGSWGLVQN